MQNVDRTRGPNPIHTDNDGDAAGADSAGTSGVSAGGQYDGIAWTSSKVPSIRGIAGALFDVGRRSAGVFTDKAGALFRQMKVLCLEELVADAASESEPEPEPESESESAKGDYIGVAGSYRASLFPAAEASGISKQDTPVADEEMYADDAAAGRSDLGLLEEEGEGWVLAANAEATVGTRPSAPTQEPLEDEMDDWVVLEHSENQAA